jgi:hypothetical protein
VKPGVARSLFVFVCYTLAAVLALVAVREYILVEIGLVVLFGFGSKYLGQMSADAEYTAQYFHDEGLD